jgi:hypothetical protein
LQPFPRLAASIINPTVLRLQNICGTADKLFAPLNSLVPFSAADACEIRE